MRRELGAAGLGALTAVAVLGWTRAPQPMAASAGLFPVEQASFAAEGPVTYPMPRAGAQAPQKRRTGSSAQSQVAPRSRASQISAYDPVQVNEGRSTKKSVAIVAGSAA